MLRFPPANQLVLVDWSIEDFSLALGVDAC
jgi:hypothetical protein